MNWYLDKNNRQLFQVDPHTRAYQKGIYEDHGTGYTVVAYFGKDGCMYHVPISECLLLSTEELQLASILYME